MEDLAVIVALFQGLRDQPASLARFFVSLITENALVLPYQSFLPHRHQEVFVDAIAQSHNRPLYS